MADQTTTSVKVETKDTERPPVRAHHGYLLPLKRAWQSRKLWMTMFVMVSLSIAYWQQVRYLYSFGAYQDPLAGQMITAYVSLTRDFMVAFTAALLGYLSINGVVQWRHGTQSVVQQISEAVTRKEDITQKIDERVVQEYAERYRDDESYVPPDKLPERYVEEFR